MGKHDGEVWRTIRGHRVQIDSPGIQEQLSVIFGNKKERKDKTINIGYSQYKRIRDQVFNYPKKYKNGKSYYIDLDNDLYELSVENHTPIIHNVIKNYEQWLDIFGVELGDSKK